MDIMEVLFAPAILTIMLGPVPIWAIYLFLWVTLLLIALIFSLFPMKSVDSLMGRIQSARTTYAVYFWIFLLLLITNIAFWIKENNGLSGIRWITIITYIWAVIPIILTWMFMSHASMREDELRSYEDMRQDLEIPDKRWSD